VREDAHDDNRIFDGGDDLQARATVRAVFDGKLKNRPWRFRRKLITLSGLRKRDTKRNRSKKKVQRTLYRTPLSFPGWSRKLTLQLREVRDMVDDGLSLLIGGLIVFLVTGARFSHPVAPPQELPGNVPRWLGRLAILFRKNPNPTPKYYRPARANTTPIRYRVYQFAYAIIALIIFLLLVEQPHLRQQVSDIVAILLNNNQVPFLQKSGPLLIAAAVTLVLPYVPVLRSADVCMRRNLYMHASLPAQQLREMNRLKHARYQPNSETIEAVRKELVAEGFIPDDVAYDPEVATTQSLWTKCAVLVVHINELQTDDNYKKPFAALFDPEKEQRSVESVKDNYEALMGDGKACFAALRSDGAEDDPVIEKQNEVFRAQCKELLLAIYGLISAISLLAHYSDEYRVKEMARIGFQLKRTQESPVPGPNEVLALVIILGTGLVVPLSSRMGVWRAVFVGAMMLTAVITPILLARFFPRFATRGGGHAPPIAFPIIAGLTATSLGALIMLGMNYIYPQAYCGAGALDQYANCSYPWSFPHGGIAALIAWRMRAGTYPDVHGLRGFRRYQVWGSLRDSAIFVVLMVTLTAFAVVPLLDNLRGKVAVAGVPADPKVRFAMLAPIYQDGIGVRLRIKSIDNKRMERISSDLTDLQATLEHLDKVIDGPTVFSFTVLTENLIRTKDILTTVVEEVDNGRESDGAGVERTKMVVMEAGAFEGRMVGLLTRIGLMSALVGFFVPTWYRAQRARRVVDRRTDTRRRQRFEARLRANSPFQAIQP
jgi:hypothetical protein